MKVCLTYPHEYHNLIIGSTYSSLGYRIIEGVHLINNKSPEYMQSFNNVHMYNGTMLLNAVCVPKNKYISLYKLMSPDEVTLPESVGNSVSTSIQHMDKNVLTNIPINHRMIVPHGNTWEEWLSCLTTIINNIQFYSIGLPSYLEDFEGGRSIALDILKIKKLLNHPIQLLGINKHPFTEVINALKTYPYIRGINTSVPLAYASNYSVIKDEDKPDYSWDKNGINHNMIKHNIEQYIRFCRTEANRYKLKYKS